MLCIFIFFFYSNSMPILEQVSRNHSELGQIKNLFARTYFPTSKFRAGAGMLFMILKTFVFAHED